MAARGIVVVVGLSHLPEAMPEVDEVNQLLLIID